MKKVITALVVFINLSVFPALSFADPIGNIKAPATIPTVQSGDPTSFVAGLVRGVISLLIIVAFIIALVWTIFAGYRFVFSGGDPKNVSSAWSQIYWGLLGMAIVLGAYAIVRLAEVFFSVSILSTDLKLPTI